jgi:HlyD family secretion protein
MTFKLFVKPGNKWLISLVTTSIFVTSGIAIYSISHSQQANKTLTSQAIQTKPIVPKVTALGRLEPEAEVITLSAPLALDGDRIAELLVTEGDRVKAGQVIAILDSRDRLQDAVQQAQEQVKVSEAKLAQVKAGAKIGQIQAQKEQISRLEAELIGEIKTQDATIARLQAQVNNARSEYNRHQQLYRDGAISTSTLDSKILALETAHEQLNEALATQDRTTNTIQAQLAEARANLDQISEVRPVDVQAAQTEVDSAISALERAKTDLAQAYVRAPIASQVLKIQTRSGEKIGDEGIVELAQTDSMIAIAEVYQSDIAKVKLGQSAEITGQAFQGIVRGKVYQVGLQVSRQNVFSDQPGENLDRRVVEVKIRLDPEDSKRVAGLTNLQIQTAIRNQRSEVGTFHGTSVQKAEGRRQKLTANEN